MKELEDCLREALEESPYGIVTNDTALETARKYASELLQQRDELREALRGAIGIIRTWHGIGIIDEAKEADMWRIYSSHAPEMKKLIAAIKNTDG